MNQPTDSESRLVDSHVHVWDAAVAAVDERLRLAGSPEALLRTLDENGVKRAVVVQPSVHGKDHSYLLDAVRSSGGRLAAVGLIEPDDRRGTVAQLEALTARTEVRGLRVPLIRSRDRWFEDVGDDIWQHARREGLIVCAFLGPSNYAQLSDVLTRYPDVNVVVDHVGRIDLWMDRREDALRSLVGLATFPQLSVKISALGAVGVGPFPYRQSWPEFHEVLAAFGPHRLMWGSDYPSSLAYGTYSDEVLAASLALADCSLAERTAIFRSNALQAFWGPT